MRTGMVLNDVTLHYKTNINFYTYWFKTEPVISEFLHIFNNVKILRNHVGEFKHTCVL